MPDRELMQADYDHVEELAAKGADLRTLAKQISVRWADFLRLRKTDDKLEDAIRAGWGRAETALVNRLFRTAMDGKGRESLTAAIFLLKGKFHWRDQGPSTDDDAPRFGVQIINLPAALSVEQYKQLTATHPQAIEAETVDAEAVEVVPDAD